MLSQILAVAIFVVMFIEIVREKIPAMWSPWWRGA